MVNKVMEHDLRRWMRLVEDTLSEAKASAYYHVTLTKNLPSIQQHGLLPKNGSLSTLAGEGKPAIYLFRSIEAAEEGVTNWMGDYLPEEEPLALLKVVLPVGLRTRRGENEFGYEFKIYQPIPPQNLEVLTKDFDNFVSDENDW
jgi:hypothetical protein